MIFVAVGTQRFPFDRLLRAVDGAVKDGLVSEEVFAQVGHSNYLPNYFDAVPFLSTDEFKDCVESCSCLVTHGGVGTITMGLSLRKPVIVVPRLRRFDEHVDNHQLEIAEAFAARSIAICCFDEESIRDALRNRESFDLHPYESGRGDIVRLVREYIDGWAGLR